MSDHLSKWETYTAKILSTPLFFFLSRSMLFFSNCYPTPRSSYPVGRIMVFLLREVGLDGSPRLNDNS